MISLCPLEKYCQEQHKYSLHRLRPRRPANPKNASEISDATTNAIGAPLSASGIGARSSRSLIPAISNRAKPKPNAVPIENMSALKNV